MAIIVSVVIPTFNDPKIGNCLKSLRTQNFPSKQFEILVVDNGSSKVDVKRFCKQYRVCYISEPRKGAYFARNTGLKNSHGQYVLFTDSDCRLDKNWVKEMIRPFSNSKVGVVGGRIKKTEPTNWIDVSLCSMNMIMKREVIPAIYQIPMNEPIVPNWRIDRYGDIWGGYICKKLIDIKGDILSVGEPLIFHHKEGNVNKNILQEHYSHIVNLRFCDIIDKACEDVKKGDYLDMYENFAQNLRKLEPKYPPSLKDYLIPTCQRMLLWVKALRLPNIARRYESI